MDVMREWEPKLRGRGFRVVVGGHNETPKGSEIVSRERTAAYLLRGLESSL